MPDLTLYNSLTRSLEPFRPIDPANVRIYTCGPTVYNYQHIGNMRAYVFADTLGRVLRWKGWPTTHIINITDVGHLTSDADTGDDKMEKAAASAGKSIWEIAAHYTEAFKADVARLNIVPPAEWTVATDYIEKMKDFATVIENNGFTYELSEEDAPGAAGLYFRVSKLGERYGRLARHETEAAGTWVTEGRIDLVEVKETVADFALWRTTPPGERRQMEWDSPWGRGAPGWHLECSVMSREKLGHPFDIHTGGIDHREIHHPNEIAQNQAYCACENPGANIWMHNNFLVQRNGKMSKSSGGFLTLQALVDRGFHPLAYRMMCLQAHYRSELEFSWDNLSAASTRLKRWIVYIEGLRSREPAAHEAFQQQKQATNWQSFEGALAHGKAFQIANYKRIDAAASDDLGTPGLVSLFDAMLRSELPDAEKLEVIARCDALMGLDLTTITRTELRVQPTQASMGETEVEARLAERREARAAKDFARADAIREDLAAAGVEVMDGDPLGWDWKV